MFRPKNVKVFEPINPEYSLADAITAEIVEGISPKILWWSFDKTATVASQDELDKILGEKGSGDAKYTYTGPKEVFCFFEFNPIIWELSRLGVEQIEEISIYTNVADFLNRNNAHPKPGDLFRISYVKDETTYRNIFYTVSVVVPVDMFNFKHLNWRIYAEQQDLDAVAQYIKNYVDYL